MAETERFYDRGVTTRHINLDFGFAAQFFFKKLLQRLSLVEHLVARYGWLNRDDQFVLRHARVRHEPETGDGKNQSVQIGKGKFHRFSFSLDVNGPLYYKIFV